MRKDDWEIGRTMNDPPPLFAVFMVQWNVEVRSVITCCGAHYQYMDKLSAQTSNLLSLVYSYNYTLITDYIMEKLATFISAEAYSFSVYSFQCLVVTNLGITRTWICRLIFAQRPIFSGLRFFNESEISDPSRRTCTQDFTSWKNPSTSAGFEPANLGSRNEHVTPKPPRPTISKLSL